MAALQVTQKGEKMGEPRITINGVVLSNGAAMTIRVAVENFAMWLHENGLGEDEHGQAMTKGYLDRIKDIRKTYM